MPEMTVVSDVETALRSLRNGDDKASHSVHNPAFNTMLKEKPITALKQMGFNFSGNDFSDDDTIVIIDDDPHKNIQYNDDKMMKWIDGKHKYIVKIPSEGKTVDGKSRDFQKLAEWLVDIYHHAYLGGISAEGL
jgi:hypothetical protein